MHTTSHPISGSRLEVYLDQTEESLAQQDDTELDPELLAASLKSALEAERFRADTWTSLQRLFHLWLRAGAPLSALALLDGDGAAVVAALPDDEQVYPRISLSLLRLQALFALQDRAALRAGLEASHDLMAATPLAQQYDGAWEQLASDASAAGEHALARRCAQARHALERASPGRQALQAWDDALLAIRQAQSFQREGDLGAARGAAQQAIACLAGAGPDQDVDHGDWLCAAHALVGIVPDTMAAIVPQIRDRLPEGTAFFALREFDVRIARLEALALHQQGQLAEALKRGRLARTILRDDPDDGFSAHMLDWLLEAGRQDDAARLAFESVFYEREVSAEHAWRSARQVLANAPADDTPGQPFWYLTLGYAGMAEATADARDGEPEASYVPRHLDLARAGAGACSGAAQAADAVGALYLIKSKRAYARALPLLEAASRELSLAHADLIIALWTARIHVHGVQAGLALPFVPAVSAGACYNTGVMLEYDLNQQLPDGMQVADPPRKALGARYYEAGLARYEAFVLSGEGNVRDGDAHAYSMLCNNLAIYYRYEKSDHAAALQLHRKGLAASPFSEHYDGIMGCHRASGNEAALLAAAEELWHYSAEHGYSRHDPTNYVDNLSRSLHRLGRPAEIAIWLQRLDQWWEGIDAQTRMELNHDYLRALVGVLYYMALAQPDDAVTRLEPALAAIKSAASPYTSRTAGHVLRSAGHFERAVTLYHDALRHIRPDDEGAADERSATVEAIGESKRLQRKAEPWWKFW